MNETPDLTNEFHPVPKLYKAKKTPKPLSAGKKTQEWDSEREKVKKQFDAWGIRECELKLEGCWRNNALTFAHVDKRRYLRPGELNKVVLACTPCHQKVEEMPREEMRKLLENTINNRANML